MPGRLIRAIPALGVAVALAVGAVPAGPAAAEPLPAGPAAAERIRAYHDSGAWARDRAAVASRALESLEAWRAANPGAAGALVTDLDDTLVSWYRAYERADFARKAPARWCAQPVIRPVASLLARARELGVRVIVLTGRREAARERTTACLRRLGIAFDRLVMREPSEERLTAARWKAGERARIEASGLPVVVAIGDQASDLAGGHAIGAYRLPNPMYVIR